MEQIVRLGQIAKHACVGSLHANAKLMKSVSMILDMDWSLA